MITFECLYLLLFLVVVTVSFSSSSKALVHVSTFDGPSSTEIPTHLGYGIKIQRLCFFDRETQTSEVKNPKKRESMSREDGHLNGRVSQR